MVDYSSMVRFLLFLIGFLDIVFGSIFLLVFLNKGLYNVENFLVIFISLIGGLSCLVAARQPNLKKLNNMLMVGLGIGIMFGVIYIYIIALAFSRL